MRVLDTYTGQFVHIDPQDQVLAILSHTWDPDNGEQTFQELQEIQKRYISERGASSQRVFHRQLSSSSTAVPKGGVSRTPSPSLAGASISASSSSSLSSIDASIARLNEQIALLAERVSLTERRTGVSPETPRAVGAVPPLNPVVGQRHSPLSASALPEPGTSEIDIPEAANPSVSRGIPLPPLSPESSTKSRTQTPLSPIWDDPDLSPKIKMACKVARETGFRYLWIDSCCINRESSSELSEAINSMYAWYGDADVCYAYLADVPPGATPQSRFFRESRWFTRGWTLQELIAPDDLIFLNADWEIIGWKDDLVDVLEKTTGIDRRALLHETELEKFSVAQRFSWASMRETERVEDRAYSLMGIFDINMPILYGEGERALRRLQEEILRRTPDQSLFAWGSAWGPSLEVHEELDDATSADHAKAYECVAHHPSYESLIAVSLSSFLDASTITSVHYDEVRRRLQLYGLSPTEYTSTPYGIRTQLPVLPLSAILHPDETKVPDDHPMSHWYLAILGCEHGDHPGHLLGRVCRIPPSESGVDLLYAGWIRVVREGRYLGFFEGPDMLALSPATVERCRSQIVVRTVYISHPARRYRDPEEKDPDDDRPHGSIFLRLSRETRDALCAQQYTTSLRRPDQAHPTTHRLTLSHHDHTVSIEYDHTLEDGGKRLTMRARVEVSGGLGPSPRDVLSTQSPSEVSWSDTPPWFTTRRDREVTVRAGEKEFTVTLGLTFLRPSWYAIQVGMDRHSDDASIVGSQ